MRVLLVASLIVLSGCGPDSTQLRCTSSTDVAPMLGENFTVRYHESATIQNEELSVAFSEVVNDSRCPSGGECAWEGNAEVKITATKANEQPQVFSLNTNGGYETAASYQGYTLQLVSLVPYPEQFGGIAAQDYCAELRATKP